MPIKKISMIREESAGIKILGKFLKKGYLIDYTDKYIPWVDININKIKKKSIV